MNNEPIKVFSTQQCPYCVMLKNYLDENKIEYKNVDVSSDSKAAEEMFNRSHHMGVPQVWIGDKTIVGYDPASINEILGIR